MPSIDPSELEPNGYYWARRLAKSDTDEPAEVEIVHISTVFGSGRDYFSVALFGTDQHHSLKDFEFLAKISVIADGR